LDRGSARLAASQTFGGALNGWTQRAGRAEWIGKAARTDHGAVIRLVYAPSADALDGIRRYAELCTDALRTHADLPAQLELWSRTEPPAAPGAGDVVALQYNPFSFGRRGVAPWLVRRVAALRRQRGDLRIVLVLHEAYVPAKNPRWALMSAWQRSQLAALGRCCDAVIVSTEAWRARAERLIPRKAVFHVPVGSNLPDQRTERARVRRVRGWQEETVVIGTFGADPAARLGGLVVQATNHVSQLVPNTVLAQLGACRVVDEELSDAVRTYQPGVQQSDEVAAELSAVDVFLAPYEDGVSARRTTLMAAMQQALAIVGTVGRNTDSYLARDARLRLVDASDAAAFASATATIATDQELRNQMSLGARDLFDERFSWPTIASQLAEIFGR
jgi:glycosyltransferase involved in cell wall biosynthesis